MCEPLKKGREREVKVSEEESSDTYIPLLHPPPPLNLGPPSLPSWNRVKLLVYKGSKQMNIIQRSTKTEGDKIAKYNVIFDSLALNSDSIVKILT